MLSRLESGDTQPSIATVQRILRRLGSDLHLELRPSSREPLRREKQRSLWLNRVVVGELSRDPERAIGIARDNLERWRAVHASSPTTLAALDRWGELLDVGVEAIVAVLTGMSEEAEELRQNSPFAGVLTPDQRQQALDSFRAHWESQRLLPPTDKAPRKAG